VDTVDVKEMLASSRRRGQSESQDHLYGRIRPLLVLLFHEDIGVPTLRTC